MEALAVIGLTANILQFMDVAWDIFKLGSEVRRQGHDSVRNFNHFDHDPIWTAIKMREFATQPGRRQFSICDTEAEKTLNQISDECIRIANELASIMVSLDRKYRLMNQIAPGHPIKVLKSWKFAIKLLREQDHIQKLSERLEKCRGLLSSSVLIHVLKRMDEMLNEQRRIEQETENSHLHRHETTLETMELYAAETRKYFTDIKTHFKKVEGLLQGQSTTRPQTSYPPIPGIFANADPSLKVPVMSVRIDRQIESDILGNLAFLMMDDREKKVKKSFQQTFSWIFKQNFTEGSTEVDFNQWLQQKGEMYWISGKAGCGKSTLMKFLRHHSQTKDALKIWAGGDDLVMASYFCWAAGTELQKNQEGLLRAILYQIVKQRPNLIPLLFPRRYEAIMNKIFEENETPEIFFSCDRPSCATTVTNPKDMVKHLKKAHKIEVKSTKEQTSHYSSRVFPTSELEQAFENLALTKLSRVKIALFVDGLDEYGGDQRGLIEIFQDVTKLPNVKAVVSSRPETLFSNAFDDLPFIRMENLTREDIMHYVRVTLGQHQRMKRLEEGEPGFLEGFTQKVVAQSSGVFLWTALAVAQLQSALDDGCFADELRSILDDYPEELHDLYCHMFQRMKIEHRGEGYRLLRCAQYANSLEGQFPSLLRFWFMMSEIPGSSVDAKGELMDRLIFLNNLELAATRIKSRCCGLLECTWLSSEDYYEGTVTPFHRTISDFLADEMINTKIMEEVDDCRPTDWLLDSIIWCLKKKWIHRTTTHEDWKKLRIQLDFATTYMKTWKSQAPSNVDLLDAIDSSMLSLWRLKDKVLRSGAKTSRKSFGSYENHWSQALLPTAILRRTDASRYHPLAWLALCENALDVVKTRVLREFHCWDEGWGYLFTKLVCLGIYQPPSTNTLIEIIDAMAKHSSPASGNKTSTGSFWSRNAWEILIFLQPLGFNALKLPPDMRELATIGSNQASTFSRWAHMINIFLRGSHLNHPCAWIDTTDRLNRLALPAGKLIEDGIEAYRAAQLNDTSPGDYNKDVELLEAFLNEH